VLSQLDPVTAMTSQLAAAPDAASLDVGSIQSVLEQVRADIKIAEAFLKESGKCTP